MTAKKAIVTGANSGIGFETAKALVERGVHVLMVCRNPALGDAARQELSSIAIGPRPNLYIADLVSQQQIRKLAADLHNEHNSIDILVNNAGGVFAPKQSSQDGIEKTFAINHLAPFLLTNLLLDLVSAAPGGRIVNVVTEVYPSRLNFNNLQGEKFYNFFFAYMHSKLANIIFTNELARRLQDTGMAVNSISPGPTVTKFGAADLHGLPSLMPKVMMRLPIFVSADKGARGVVRLAAAPELAGVSGRFFLREREIQAKPVTRDRQVAQRLWDISERLTGLSDGGIVAALDRRTDDKAAGDQRCAK